MGRNMNQSKDDLTSRKRNLKLDINCQGQLKKGRFDLESAIVLNSPDIKKLKLRTPDIENIILQQNPLNGATPTPNGSASIFLKHPTEEQENFTKGFEEALNNLHGSDSSQGMLGTLDNSNSCSSSDMTYTDLDPSSRHTDYSLSPLQVVIKDEPQTVPSMADSPLMSPIDMDKQEVEKLERKRQRNRLAASKCRRRKLERIAKLEDKVKDIKNENTELGNALVQLNDHVHRLKAEVIKHVNYGCQIMHIAEMEGTVR